MKSIITRIIIILIGISIFRTLQNGEPIIYVEKNHNKSEILESINHLKEATRYEIIIALSDSMIASIIRMGSSKISQLKYDYYDVIDWSIDYYKKDMLLSSMTLDEWREFKRHKNNWEVLAGGSTPLGQQGVRSVSNDYRIKELELIEAEVLKN